MCVIRHANQYYKNLPANNRLPFQKLRGSSSTFVKMLCYEFLSHLWNSSFTDRCNTKLGFYTTIPMVEQAIQQLPYQYHHCSSDRTRCCNDQAMLIPWCVWSRVSSDVLLHSTIVFLTLRTEQLVARESSELNTHHICSQRNWSLVIFHLRGEPGCTDSLSRTHAHLSHNNAT